MKPPLALWAVWALLAALPAHAATVQVRPGQDLQAAITAACLGLGFTRVLSYQVARKVAAGELQIVLAEFELAPLPIHVIYQGGRKAPARVRSFVDFTVNALREHPALKNEALLL